MATKIDTPTSRGRLEPRREPYWHVLGRGQAIGYRAIEKPSTKPKKSARGTWITRYRNEDGGHLYESLGELSDYEDAERFEVACRKAQEWITKCRGGMSEVVTVKTACDDYLADLRLRKGPSAEQTAKTRIKAHIEKPLGGKRVDKLTYSELLRWRDGLVVLTDDPEKERATKNSANRTATVLKALLNQAAKRHKIIDRTPWGDLKPFANVAGTREIYLTKDEKKRLLKAATGSLLNLIKAGFLTGARLSELTTATAGDLDAKQGTLYVKGKTGERSIVLSDDGQSHFSRRWAKARRRRHGLLPRNDGSRGTGIYLSKRFREVAKSGRSCRPGRASTVCVTGISVRHCRRVLISNCWQEMSATGRKSSGGTITSFFRMTSEQINKLSVQLG